MNVTTVSAGDGPARVGLVISRFNQAITERLAEGALAVLESESVDEVVVSHVPGALELGVVAAALFEAGCQAVVAVGAVIKGETDHYEYVAAEASRGLMRSALDAGRPVGNALLTVREHAHAEERSLPGPSNKGAEAARAAIDTHRVLAGIQRLTAGES